MIGYSSMKEKHLSSWIALFFFLGVWHLSHAGPITAPHAHTSEAERALHDAAHRVDEAWEIYHQAALGGTLASPATQAQVERDLHEARLLLVKARDTVERGDLDDLDPILAEIKQLTDRAIKGSRERKR